MAPTPPIKRVRLCVASSIIRATGTPFQRVQDQDWIGYWCGLPEDCRTVGEWEEYVRKQVLRRQNEQPLELSIDGYVLPFTESLNLVREEDVVFVSSLQSLCQVDASKGTERPTEHPRPLGLVSDLGAATSAQVHVPRTHVLVCGNESTKGNSRSARRKALKRRRRREAKAQEGVVPCGSRDKSMLENDCRHSHRKMSRMELEASPQQVLGQRSSHEDSPPRQYAAIGHLSLVHLPRVGDTLRYRTLELSETWEPFVSEMQMGTVVTYDQSTGTVTVDPSRDSLEQCPDSGQDCYLHLKLSELRDATIRRGAEAIPIFVESQPGTIADRIEQPVGLNLQSQESTEPLCEYVVGKEDKGGNKGNFQQRKAPCRGIGALWPALQCLRESGDI